MRLASSVLALALLAPAAAHAQGARPDFVLQAPPFGYGSLGFVLPSGLEVLIQEDSSAPMVAVATIIAAGEITDPEGKRGSARLAEMLWFQSRHEDGPRVQDRLFELGAVHDARTRPDFVSFFTAAPVESIRGVLELESLRLTEPTAGIGDPQLAAARELVRYAPLLSGGDPIDIAMPEILPRLFPEDWAYNRLGPLGAELDGVTVADLEAFTKANYRPENTTMVIVSPLDPQKVLDALFWTFDPSLIAEGLTEDMYGKYLAIDYDGDPGAADPENPDHMSMRPQDPNNPDEMLDIQGDLVARLEGDGQPPEDAHGTSKEVIHVQAPVSVPTTVVAWSVPAAYRGDDYLLNVAAGTLTGILRPFFTEEPGLLIDPETGKPAVECRVDGMPQASVIACYAEMKPRSLPDSIADRITDQVGQLWNPDMQTTLNNTYISGRFDAMAKDLHATEDFSDPKSGRAIQLAKHVHFSGSTTMAGDMIRSILEATSSEVSTFAVDFLDRKRSVKLYLEPNAAAAALSSLGAGGYAGDMLASKAASEPDPEEITPEAIRAVFHGPDLSNAVDRTLSNGLRVVVVPHGDSPLFSATLVAKGGKKTGDGGLDDFMEYNSTAIPHSDLWEGADADPIAIAGLWDNGRTSTYSQHTLKASAGNIDAVLWKLRRVVETRTTSPENKSRWANNTSDSVNSRWGSAVYWSDRLQTDRLAPGYDGFQYPDHNSIAAYKSLGSAEIKSYLDGKYQPGNSVLVIVGGMDPDAVMAEVEKRFGDWSARGGDAPAAPGPLAAPTGGGTFVLNTGGLQAVVDMSCQLPAWSAANAGAQQVAAGLLTEQLNERLLADGVVLYQGYSQAQQYAGGASLLQLYAVVDADSAGKTVNTLSELAAAMGKGEVDATRLGVAKRHLAQSYALRFQTLEQMRDAVVGLTTAPNMSLDFYDAYGDALAAVTPEAVGKELGSCTAHAVTAVRGDAAKIESSLSGAGVSYELFDWRAEGDAMLEAQDPKAYKKLLKDRAKGK